MKNNIVIRLEEKSEYREVENLVRDSFWNVYRSGCLEHYVINQLRNDRVFVPELDFVMYLKENDEEGNNANYAQTECQFRYCGTAIPFLTVRSTAR